MRAGRCYEQMLDSEHRGDIFVIYWNSSTYLLNPEQLHLHLKRRQIPAVEPHEAAVACPSTYLPIAKHGPADESMFEVHAFEGDEDLTDFKTEYHPRSKCLTLFQTSDEFHVHNTSKPPPNPTPWCPFRCKGDFEFAEIVLEASLNKRQVESLLDLISCVAKGEAEVTFVNEPELWKLCDWAAEELTPNGVQFERFYDEPWTADSWWDIQNVVAFVFILYADKSKLSSFGTVKGYPVIMCCANLPAHIRNGNDIGGGTVVGWLPIVPEDAEEDGKLSYMTLKHVVWHESFFKLLEEVIQHARSGYVHACHDKIERTLFPLILILSADYEEQCMMSLIHGHLAKCPCPVCLVPLDELHNLATSSVPQSQEQAEAAFKAWEESRTKGEEILKKLGLRPIQNIFWFIPFSDPHLALSFNRLHSLHLGIWGKHIFGEIKKILEYLGRAAETMVEKYVAAFPLWWQLTHFSTVINITFNNGNKMRDLAKQVFYSLLNVFKKQSVPEGCALLRMLQIYLELDSLIRLNVHMERTISMIESELLKFNEALKEYIALAEKSEIPGLKMDWDFPKVHLWTHAVHDIRSKGVARNYSTRPNESMHSALREAYNHCTNGRDVVSQILRVDQHMFAMKLIRQSFNSQDTDNEDSAPDLEDETLDDQPWTLSSQCKPAPMQSFETSNSTNTTFSGLRKKFAEFLNASARGSGHQNISYIRIPPGTSEHQLHQNPSYITEYRYLKMNYGSTVDWRETTDHLQCNLQFYGKPCYDCALIQQMETTVTFICFILIFTCCIPELDGTFEFALVQPFTRRTGASRHLDRDLNLIRLKTDPQSPSIFIPIASIVRGAVLAPNPENADEFLMLSYLDDDMFLRLKDATISGT
ncbi:hypothetical protein BDN67DRAFT_991595 [Paxillus ammoniavirescens]|nr:hypothetical protein BDN67DRAFT_991595 [Paxillus ammoniavirescens]